MRAVREEEIRRVVRAAYRAEHGLPEPEDEIVNEIARAMVLTAYDEMTKILDQKRATNRRRR